VKIGSIGGEQMPGPNQDVTFPGYGVHFHASWWTKNHGRRYDREHYMDPDYQRSWSVKGPRLLEERFPGLGIGDVSPEPSVHVSGPGIISIPQLLGCEVRFHDNDEPFALPLDIDDETLDDLEPHPINELDGLEPLATIVDNVEWMRREHGSATAGVNWQGPLNVALKVRGDRLFMDMLSAPDLSRKMLGVAAEEIVRVNRFLASISDDGPVPLHSGSPLQDMTDTGHDLVLHDSNGTYTNSDCCVVMISPDQYSEHILPHDRYIAERLTPHGVHHCGTIDAYLEGYRSIGDLEFLEAGWGSDIARVREVFPDIRLSARMGPQFMGRVGPEEVYSATSSLIQKGRPWDRLSIVVVGVDTDVPDENVRALVRAVNDSGDR